VKFFEPLPTGEIPTSAAGRSITQAPVASFIFTLVAMWALADFSIFFSSSSEEFSSAVPKSSPRPCLISIMRASRCAVLRALSAL